MDPNNPWPRIQWARKVRPNDIRRLYETDAQGIRDLDLIDGVGTALFARCKSIMQVSRREVSCPKCHNTTHVPQGIQDEAIITCPDVDCDWQSTYTYWHRTWQHQDLWGGRAMPVFKEFLARYPHAHEPRKKMLLINELLHQFHRGLKANHPHRSVANNLLESKHRALVEYLDKLTYGKGSTPGLPDVHKQWQRDVEVMWQIRRGEFAEDKQ